MSNEEISKIADMLERNASLKHNEEITTSTAKYEGYIQACEDFSKLIIQKWGGDNK